MVYLDTIEEPTSTPTHGVTKALIRAKVTLSEAPPTVQSHGLRSQAITHPSNSRQLSFELGGPSQVRSLGGMQSHSKGDPFFNDLAWEIPLDKFTQPIFGVMLHV